MDNPTYIPITKEEREQWRTSEGDVWRLVTALELMEIKFNAAVNERNLLASVLWEHFHLLPCSVTPGVDAPMVWDDCPCKEHAPASCVPYCDCWKLFATMSRRAMH